MSVFIAFTTFDANLANPGRLEILHMTQASLVAPPEIDHLDATMTHAIRINTEGGLCEAERDVDRFRTPDPIRMPLR